jgi:hypothetical protein
MIQQLTERREVVRREVARAPQCPCGWAPVTPGDRVLSDRLCRIECAGSVPGPASLLHLAGNRPGVRLRARLTALLNARRRDRSRTDQEFASDFQSSIRSAISAARAWLSRPSRTARSSASARK